MNDAAEVFIPITMFFSMAVVISLFFMFRYRARRDLQDTLRTAIEKGQELTPEIIERLGTPPAAPDRDLRRALVALGIAVGFALFGVVLGEEDAMRPLLAVSCFPLVIGIAFLLMYRFGAKRQ
jgi:hypothetical protein